MPETTTDEKRTMVLDTCDFIENPNTIYNFAEHDVVVVMTVVEELDHLKKLDDLRGANAREASRILKQYADKLHSPNDSISLGEGKGNLSFFVFDKYPELPNGVSLRDAFMEDTPDHRIIASAYILQQRGLNVTLVTMDTNVIIKAKSLGVNAEDYKYTKVKNSHYFDKEVREIDPEDLCYIPRDGARKDYYKNEPAIVSGCSDGQNHIYRWDGDKFIYVNRSEIGDTGIKSKNLEQDFAVNVLMDPKIWAVALYGAAGSGKTLLALACALAQRGRYKKILIGRSAVELADRSMGYLPGTLEEKYGPYLSPFFSTFSFIMEEKGVEKKEDSVKWMKEYDIEPIFVNVVRGETYNNAFIIIDESQNLGEMEIKTIASRAGKGTKIVFAGDINQIDLPYLTKETCGLSHLIDRFHGQKFFSYIKLQKSERSELAEAADKLL